jgi:hypothetical protein
MKTISHINHSPGRQIEHDANATRGIEQAARTYRKNAGPIDPRVGSVSKHTQIVAVHPGMKTKSQSGADAISGHHASAIDALSGQTTVPGNVTAQPGYANSGIQAGQHPFAKPIPGKNLKSVAASFGMRSRSATPLADIGKAIMDEAFANSNADDRAAHGRK